MSQKLIIGILVAIILIGGGAWYYQTNMAGKSDASSSRSETREMNEGDEGGVFEAIKKGAGNFADVLKGGDALECRFSGTDPETKEYAKGTIFVDGESFKMNADTVVEGTPTVVNVIQHEKVVYMWSDDKETMPALKIDLSMFKDSPESEKPKSPIDMLKDLESGMEYECRGWSSRGDSFEPPADIEFMDMFGGLGEMFGGMMQQGMAEDKGGEEGQAEESAY